MAKGLDFYSALVEPLGGARELGVAIIDRELRFVRVSEMLARENGLSSADHVGKPLSAVLPPRVAEVALGPLRRVFETGEAVFGVELELEVDGRPRAWTDHFLPIKNDGVVEAVAVVVVDHTAFRSTLQALRKSEERFRAISETAPIGVFLTDAEGRSLYSNQVNLDQLGLTLEESLGHGWERAIHPDDVVRVRDSFYAATLSRTPYHGMNRYLHADGRVVWVDVKANGIYDGDTLLGYVGAAEDVTDRLAAERALRESEMRFRQLAENIDSVFWLSTADHREILYVSPKFECIWGRPTSTMARFEEYIETIYPEDRAIIIGASRRPERCFTIEYRIVRPDGQLRWISDRGFPVRDENGVVIRQAGIATDITERKALEAQALQSDKLDSIGRLAGGIAHDFNNVLAVVQGQIASAARDLDESIENDVVLDRHALRERVREVEVATERAAELTRHLLMFARRQEVQVAVLDLNDVITGIESLLRRLLGERVTLHLALAGDLAIVRADPIQVEQVIVNLVANAKAAMPDGGTLTIATRNVELTERRAGALGLTRDVFVELSITDTGCGIEKDVLPHVFDPFFTTRGGAGGTGLGLSTCYGIARRSGGAMEVESCVGVGSKFCLLLPRIAMVSAARSTA